jgi:hypothetical protein
MKLNGKSTDDFYKRQILANEKMEKMKLELKLKQSQR